jgi:hypothetical protein
MLVPHVKLEFRSFEGPEVLLIGAIEPFRDRRNGASI